MQQTYYTYYSPTGIVLQRCVEINIFSAISLTNMLLVVVLILVHLGPILNQFYNEKILAGIEPQANY